MNSFIRSLVGTSNSRNFLIGAVLLSSAWLFLWYGPWQGYLHAFIWFRLGIGLILFTIPGACLYSLVVDRSELSINHITFGFIISHLLFALFGTLGRFIHLSFETIKLLMAFTGLILALQFILPKVRGGIKIDIRSKKTDRVLPVLLLLLVSVVACLVVIQRVLADDDLTYLAYITNWQNSIGLDFNDVIFGEPELVHPRFWIMSAPFAQALLADLSEVPGILLLTGYYEPFLVILSVLCWYELARTLTFSPRAASASAMMQLVFLLLLSEYLHPGAPFFKQLSADKATAAFIISPVFFQSLVWSLKSSTKSNFVLLFLAGFSLTFMHPVILAYSVFIGGVFIFLNWRAVGMSQKVIAMMILIAILLPQIALRFVNTTGQAEIPYTTQDILSQRGVENMVAQWGNTQYYGFNPGILDMEIPYEANIPIPRPLMERGWLVIPILSAALALRHAGKSNAAQILLACFLLSFLAWLPFTGWIIGYFLSAWMLERAVWLFPFGLSLIYSIAAIREHLKSNNLLKPFMHSKKPISPNWFLLAVTVFATGIFFLYIRENNLPDLEKFAEKSQRYLGLATAGQKLDRQISGYAHVIGSQQLNDMIPGISSKSKLITFRISQPSNMPYFSDAQREERISDEYRLFSKALSPGEKMTLLEKYEVRHLFLQSFDLRLFEDLITSYPDRVKVVETGGVIILQINE